MIALGLGRTLRHGLFSAGLLAPLSVGVVLRVAYSGGPTVVSRPVEAPTPCDATRIDTMCSEGQRCVAGECRVMRVAERAAEQESCAGLKCAPGLECHRNACMRVEVLPLAPMACREPAVRAALTELTRTCAQARGTAEMLLTSCNTEDWQSLSRRNTSLERHLMAMPGAFSVFYPQGKPDERQTWPSPDVRDLYMDGLLGHREELRRARQIFVIGRASVLGDERVNARLAERRARFVEGLLTKMLGAERPPILRWGLADDFTMGIEDVRQRMKSAPIAADANDVAELAKVRRPDFNLTTLSSAQVKRVTEMLNRVVFVVPLPCDGLEFNPPPAFVAAPTPEGLP